MRALALAVLLCACSSTDERACGEGRCASLPPGVSVEWTHMTLDGSPAGEWLTLGEGPAHFVLSPADLGTGLEIHAVRVDGSRVFDVGEATAGVEPRLGVRPTGAPPTLVAPAGHVEVLVRTSAPGALTVARFDVEPGRRRLAVHVTRVDSTRSEAEIESALEEAGAILGLAIEVTFAPESEAEPPQPASLAAMAPPPRAGVPVWFVSGAGARRLGCASSTPLSPLEGEGAIVIDGARASDALAATLAHELGHALGLLHVSEASGAQLEALADTPTCLDDRNGDGTRDARDCPEAAANLMFWSPGGTALTPAQRRRLQTSPLLR